MIADHRREKRNESKIVVYEPCDSFFIDLPCLPVFDNVDQRIINNELMSDIIGAKHWNAGLHFRCGRTIAVMIDREIPLELPLPGKLLPPVFQLIAQFVCKIMVECLPSLISFILVEFRHGVLLRVPLASCRTLRTLKSLIKYWSSGEFAGNSRGRTRYSYWSRHVPGSRLWTRNSLMSVHYTKGSTFQWD